MKTKITAIVMSHPGSRTLENTLSCLKGLSETTFEIIIVETICREKTYYLQPMEGGNGLSLLRFDTGKSRGDSALKVSTLSPCSSNLLGEAVRRSSYDYILFMDDSLMMPRTGMLACLEYVDKTADFGATAFSVRTNFNRRGSLLRFTTTGDLLFEFGIVNKRLLYDLEIGQFPAYRGDFLEMSFALLLNGHSIHHCGATIESFPEKGLIQYGGVSGGRFGNGQGHYERTWSKKSNQNDVLLTHLRLYSDRVPSVTVPLLARFKKCFLLGSAALLAQDVVLWERLRKEIEDLLPQVDEQLNKVLLETDVLQAIVLLLSQYEQWMELFESKLDLLNFLIFYFYKDLLSVNCIGDRDFWASFSKAVGGDSNFLLKLVNLKV